MRASTATLPAYVGVTIPGRGYSVFRINKIEEVVADEAAMKAEQQQIDEFLSTQETAAYLAIIKKRAKAEILPQAALPKAAASTAAPTAKP
jgi:peptidyl-prolyl cis-trans isomerase D